jgi:hypothetical protein
MSPPNIAESEAAAEEQEEVSEILLRGAHPTFNDIERTAALAAVEQSSVITPLIAQLYVALKDANERIREAEIEAENAYERGYADAKLDKMG